MNEEKLLKIDGEGFSAHLDGKGNLKRIIFQGKLFEPPMKYMLFEINGQAADVSGAPSSKELSLSLATKEASGRLTISSGKDVKIRFEPDKKDTVKNVGLVLPFPLDTEFHLPEIYNLGRKIDSDMPVGESYSTGLGFNFFLANCAGIWLRLMTRQPSLRNANVHISRHPEIFIATFTWTLADESSDAYVAVFATMDEALKDYAGWLENEMGVKKLRDRPKMPGWVHNVKLVLTVDMLRSNWELTHDYNDAMNLAKELKDIGCPEDTLVYIPGWNGAYDSTYPSYRPHPDLGGEARFKEMVDAFHANGFRVMIHTDAWGLDPCHPKIDEYEKFIVRDEIGNYSGWQTGGRLLKQPIVPRSLPPSRPLKIPAEKVPFRVPEGAKSFTFETSYIPDTCEALFTIGGVKVGDGRLKLTIDRRSLFTPSGWFRTHSEFDYPFPFMLKPGENKVRVEVIGGDSKPDWSESWYKLRYCFVPLNPYSTWTYPILHADMNDPGWIKIFTDEVASAVKRYGIDAVHIDATVYDEAKKLFDTLQEKLPGTVMACEWFNSVGGMGYFAFSQGARQSMLGYLDLMRGTSQQGSIPDRSDLEELYSWLNKPSPVCIFAKDYIRMYPHLCAADAFVPLGKVCQIYASRLSPRCTKELWRVTRDAQRLGYLPGLRLNYRRYGLDEETKKAIQEIARTKS